MRGEVYAGKYCKRVCVGPSGQRGVFHLWLDALKVANA